MNVREVYLKILNFENTERCLNWEFGYWGGTVKRWYDEGLTKKFGLERVPTLGESVCGPALHHPMVSISSENGRSVLADKDVSYFFNFDEGIFIPPVNHWIYPKFDAVILEEDDLKKKIIDIDGITKTVKKDETSMPYFLDWPVKDIKSWEILKEQRFNLDYEKRLNKNYFGFERILKEQKRPVHLFGEPVGFYGSVRYLIGEINLLYMYHDNPKLLKNIFSFLTDFWINIAEEILSRYKIKVAAFWEDMSGKNGALIGPNHFKEFMTPYYKRLIDFLKNKGVEHFIVDTDGNVENLIPLFMEAGITGMYPFEKQAGNDLLKIRTQYPKLQMMGGINKNVLLKNNEAIDEELETTKEMLKRGGYIPTCDHLVPPNVPFKNFKYFRKRLEEIINK
jgi:uroporphyrinogen-III decarboxylase